MSRFKKDSLLLIDYKKADLEVRKNILTKLIEPLNRLPVWFENDTEATLTNQRMFDIYQLLNYVSYKQNVETQNFFDISFDPSSLIEHFKEENDYFECKVDDQTGQKQMRLKRPLYAIPADVWAEFRKAQGLDVNLDIRNVFTPPKDAFPYTWYTTTPFDMELYEYERQQLIILLNQVNYAEETITLLRAANFNKAQKALQLICTQLGQAAAACQQISTEADENETAEEFLKLGTEKEANFRKITDALVLINHNAANLFASECQDTPLVAMTQTAALLKGTFPIEMYKDLIASLQQHPMMASSPSMQGLLTAMIVLCALAATVSIAAVVSPTFGIIAAGAGAANIAVAGVAGVSAGLFATGALCTFFTDSNKQPEQPESSEQLKLTKSMGDLVKICEDSPTLFENITSPTPYPF